MYKKYLVKLWIVFLTLALVGIGLSSVQATEKAQIFAGPPKGETYKFVFVNHGGKENPFWASVNKGFKAALDKYGLNGVMYRPPTEGDLEWQLSTLKSVVSQKPDGLITTIPDKNMFDNIIKKAIDMGIPVIASNTDDPEGTPGNARLAYVGQSLYQSGTVLAQKAVTGYFSKENPNPNDLHVLIAHEGPGLVWDNQRSAGMRDFLLGEYGVPKDQVKSITIGFSPDTQKSRMTGFLQNNPETNIILDTAMPVGSWQALKALGKGSGDIVLAGYDITPTTLSGIEEGYVTFVLNQQPYLQGYIPVVELYLMKKYGFSAWDVDTGLAVIDKTNVDLAKEMDKKGIY